MIKLYRKNHEGVLEYSEFWLNEEEGLAYYHTGIVGQEGTYTTKPCKSEQKFEKAFIKEFKKQGYQEISEDKQTWIAVQYYFRNNLDEKSVESIEDYVVGVLNEVLGWNGIGEVDGCDFGLSSNPNENCYHLNIYCVVVEPKLSVKLLKKKLPKEFGDKKPRIAVQIDDDYVEVDAEIENSKFYL